MTPPVERLLPADGDYYGTVIGVNDGAGATTHLYLLDIRLD